MQIEKEFVEAFGVFAVYMFCLPGTQTIRFQESLLPTSTNSAYPLIRGHIFSFFMLSYGLNGAKSRQSLCVIQPFYKTVRHLCTIDSSSTPILLSIINCSNLFLCHERFAPNWPVFICFTMTINSHIYSFFSESHCWSCFFRTSFLRRSMSFKYFLKDSHFESLQLKCTTLYSI